MANIQKRDFKDSAVKRAVDICGGPRFAAAYCEVTQEAVYQWLVLGEVPRTKFAVRLSGETMRRGKPVSVAELCGEEHVEAPLFSDPTFLDRQAATLTAAAKRLPQRVLDGSAAPRALNARRRKLPNRGVYNTAARLVGTKVSNG